jgi:hypothetical protein
MPGGVSCKSSRRMQELRDSGVDPSNSHAGGTMGMALPARSSGAEHRTLASEHRLENLIFP